jgi:hypothetical protein
MPHACVGCGPAQYFAARIAARELTSFSLFHKKTGSLNSGNLLEHCALIIVAIGVFCSNSPIIFAIAALASRSWHEESLWP